MKQGDRVTTKLGEGRILYTRNGPPTYSEPEAASVLLDSKKSVIGYSGTMFLAKDVKVLDQSKIRS